MQRNAALEENRIEQLLEVFAAFDLNGRGEIESRQLLHLEKARRKLGQHSDKPAVETNARLVEKMGVNGDGTVSFMVGRSDFAEFFNKVLPDDNTEFQRVVGQFMLVAEACKRPRSNSASMSFTGSWFNHSPAEGGNHSPAEGGIDAHHKEAQSALPELTSERRFERQSALQAVYREFEHLDGDGSVGRVELLLLGKMRRQLGHKGGEWTEEMNDRLLERMGAEANGDLSELNFVQHFDKTLTTDYEEFEQMIKQFMECARACRRREMLQLAVRQQKEAAEQNTQSKSQPGQQNEAFDAAMKTAAETQPSEADGVEGQKHKDAAEQIANSKALPVVKPGVLSEVFEHQLAKGKLFAKRMSELDAELEQQKEQEAIQLSTLQKSVEKQLQQTEKASVIKEESASLLAAEDQLQAAYEAVIANSKEMIHTGVLKEDRLKEKTANEKRLCEERQQELHTLRAQNQETEIALSKARADLERERKEHEQKCNADAQRAEQERERIVEQHELSNTTSPAAPTTALQQELHTLRAQNQETEIALSKARADLERERKEHEQKCNADAQRAEQEREQIVQQQQLSKPSDHVLQSELKLELDALLKENHNQATELSKARADSLHERGQFLLELSNARTNERLTFNLEVNELSPLTACLQDAPDVPGRRF